VDDEAQKLRGGGCIRRELASTSQREESGSGTGIRQKNATRQFIAKDPLLKRNAAQATVSIYRPGAFCKHTNLFRIGVKARYWNIDKDRRLFLEDNP